MRPLRLSARLGCRRGHAPPPVPTAQRLDSSLRAGITRNIFSHAVVQGGIAQGSTFSGGGDLADHNVLWRDTPPYYQIGQNGFVVVRNHLRRPIFVNRAARDYRLRRGSPGGRLRAGADPAPIGLQRAGCVPNTGR